jgi:DNA-binding response OmpR family regulator
VRVRILLADDDQDLLDLLAFALNRAGFEALRATDLPTALQRLEEQPDLAVLDVNLGAASGFDLLRELRERTQVPVIMLTGRDSEDDKVLGLELGADDYLTKPFSHRELIARIRSHLRRHASDGGMQAAQVLNAGSVTMDLRTHSVEKAGEPVSLTVTEFRLLRYLLSHANTVVPNRVILKQVWGYDDAAGTDLVRVTIHRLRRKLEDEPSRPSLLRTVPGVGFMVVAEPTGS